MRTAHGIGIGSLADGSRRLVAVAPRDYHGKGSPWVRAMRRVGYRSNLVIKRLVSDGAAVNCSGADGRVPNGGRAGAAVHRVIFGIVDRDSHRVWAFLIVDMPTGNNTWLGDCSGRLRAVAPVDRGRVVVLSLGERRYFSVPRSALSRADWIDGDRAYCPRRRGRSNARPGGWRRLTQFYCWGN